MVKHKELIDAVAEQVDLSGTRDPTAQVRDVVSAVLSTVSQALPEDQRQQLASELPGTVDEAATAGTGSGEVDGTVVVADIAERLAVTNERARYLGQAVLTGLRDTGSTVASVLDEYLPGQVVEALTPTGDSTERVTSTRSEVPTELSDDQIDKELTRLTGWHRVAGGIARTVNLPADRVEPLLERVQREAASGNDHARTRRTSDGVTFTLGTGSAGVVTEPDVLLAERIDRVVMEVGSAGKPG